MSIQTIPARRPSWRGIFAGLIMGLVVTMIMLAISLIVGSFLSLDLRGAGIAAGIYAIITALISAYVAGFFAVKASAPEALFGDGTDILPKDAALTGMLTAACIVLLTSYGAMNSATNILSGASSAVASTASGATSVVGSVASGVGGLAVAGGTAATQNNEVSSRIESAYQSAMGKVSREDIQNWLAKNTELDNAEIDATTSVIEQMVNREVQSLSAMDFTNIDTWQNLDEHLKSRAASIEETLKGDELIAKLQAQGLSEEKALHVRQTAVEAYNDVRVSTEEKINTAKAEVSQAIETAKDTARKTALYSGLFWLISTILTFVMSITGAKNAATKYRLTSPLVARRETH